MLRTPTEGSCRSVELEPRPRVAGACREIPGLLPGGSRVAGRVGVSVGSDGADKSTTAPGLLKGALEVSKLVNADLDGPRLVAFKKPGEGVEIRDEDAWQHLMEVARIPAEEIPVESDGLKRSSG